MVTLLIVSTGHDALARTYLLVSVPCGPSLAFGGLVRLSSLVPMKLVGSSANSLLLCVWSSALGFSALLRLSVDLGPISNLGMASWGMEIS